MNKAMENQAAIEALARVKALIESDVEHNRKRRERAHVARQWQDAANHAIAVDVGTDDAALIQGEIDRLRAEIVEMAKGSKP